MWEREYTYPSINPSSYVYYNNSLFVVSLFFLDLSLLSRHRIIIIISIKRNDFILFRSIRDVRENLSSLLVQKTDCILHGLYNAFSFPFKNHHRALFYLFIFYSNRIDSNSCRKHTETVLCYVCFIYIVIYLSFFGIFVMNLNLWYVNIYQYNRKLCLSHQLA